MKQNVLSNFGLPNIPELYTSNHLQHLKRLIDRIEYSCPYHPIMKEVQTTNHGLQTYIQDIIIVDYLTLELVFNPLRFNYLA